MPSELTPELYVLALDHRGTFQRGLFGIHDREPSSREASDITTAKKLIFDAVLTARDRISDPTGMAVLVDEQYGAEIAQDAKHDAFPFAIAVEKSGQDEFALEYGTRFGEHIDRFQPTYVKALVRYNPEADAELNARQAEQLQQLSDWLSGRSTRLLLEVIVPALPTQLEAANGDVAVYERDFRPRLMREAVLELQDRRVEPDIWKLEGLDTRGDCEAIVQAARRDGRTNVGCVVLGRGAEDDVVARWLVTAAPVDGYCGFAIGRTIWWTALEEYLSGAATRESAIDSIAVKYTGMIEAYRSARAHHNGATAIAGKRPASA